MTQDAIGQLGGETGRRVGDGLPVLRGSLGHGMEAGALSHACNRRRWLGHTGRVTPDSQFISIHGHQVAYRSAGEGPTVLLIHGIAGSSATWSRVLPLLARDHSVVAPDLLGHGESAKPRGDYSMGAFASGIRDLVLSLELGPVTLVGHSLGGGVAMQFAYQFPERTARLALVSSGGLGRSVH